MSLLSKIIYNPRLRYSKSFLRFQSIFSYRVPEFVMQMSMDVLSKTSKIEGDYFEFGVYTGNSFISAYHLAQSRNLKRMRFNAFDSFSGIPEDSFPYKKGDYECKLLDFVKNLDNSNVNKRKVRIIKSIFSNLKHLNIKFNKAAIIHIDSDIYSSARDALNFMIPYIQTGTILIFDDWFSFKDDPRQGEQRAFHEWIKNNANIGYVEFNKLGGVCSFILYLKNES